MTEKLRTAAQKETDEIKLQYLELEIKRSRLALRELELQYQEELNKLEAQKIMEEDRWNIYNIQPSTVPLDVQTTGITPPPGPVEELYTTVTQRFSSLVESGTPEDGDQETPGLPAAYCGLSGMQWSAIRAEAEKLWNDESILKPAAEPCGHRLEGLIYEKDFVCATDKFNFNDYNEKEIDERILNATGCPQAGKRRKLWNDKDSKELETLYTTVSNIPIPVPLPEIAYQPSAKPDPWENCWRKSPGEI